MKTLTLSLVLTLLLGIYKCALAQDIYHPIYSAPTGPAAGIAYTNLLPDENLFLHGSFVNEFQLGSSLLTGSGVTRYMTVFTPAGDTLWYEELPIAPSIIDVDTINNKVAVLFKYIIAFTYEGIYFPAIDDVNVALMQFDLNGNFEWANLIHGEFIGTLGITFDPVGDIYICGTYTDTVDFVGDTLLSTTTLITAYVVKYSGSGAGVEWVHGADGNAMSFRSITVSSSGEIAVLSQNIWGFDFQGHTSPAGEVIFKMSSAGSLIDLYAIPDDGAFTDQVAFSPDGGIYAVGSFDEFVTHFDTVPDDLPYEGRFFAHYNAALELEWVKFVHAKYSYGVSYRDQILVAPDGSMMTHGQFSQGVYFDGRYSEEMWQNALFKISEAGETEWVVFQKYVAGTIRTFCPDGNGLAWTSSSTYEDSIGLGDVVLGSSIDWETHFAKLDYVSSNGHRKATGQVFLDDNANGIFDTGDSPIETGVFSSDGIYLSLTNSSTGNYDLLLDSGAVSVLPSLPLYHFVGTPTAGEYAIGAGTSDLSDLDFAIQRVPGVNDLVVYIWTYPVVLGSNTKVFVQVKNIGTADQTDVALHLEFDSRLALTDPLGAADSIAGNSLFWTLDSLSSLASETMTIDFLVDHTTLALDDSVKFLADATSSAMDTTPINNYDVVCEIVAASFDPNDKRVTLVDGTLTPEGTVPPDAETFEYTIRFQNTGTAPAYFVRILDTLPSTLDPSTFQLIHATHNVSVDIEGGNLLTFLFDPIFLPDSGADLAGSNGMVVFQIDRKPDLPFGTEISNEAYIYFDFNEPILTEQAVLTMYDPTSGLEANVSPATLTVYPNPSGGLVNISTSFSISTYPLKGTLTDPLGRLNQQVSITKAGTISFDGLDSGLYLLRLYDSNGRLYTGSFVVK